MLERRDVMRRNGNRGIFRDVTGDLFRSFLDDETAEAPQEYVVAGDHRPLHALHKCLYDVHYHRLLYTRLSCNLCNDVCLCHVLGYFK